MRALLLSLSFASLLLCGGIFGFFYAWICSTMWGLDALDPRIAIQAMQGMNASVRNAVFAPAFFGTPVTLLVTGALALATRHRTSGILFLAAGAVYALGGFALTVMINVPMNLDLATVDPTLDLDTARTVWAAYSPRWQVWNITRTVFSGIALLLCGVGLMTLHRVPRAA